jgi:hypothetical protein
VTGWFLYYVTPDDAEPRAAARQYWPANTVVEVWNPSTPTWTPRSILEDLSVDTSWRDATKAEVDDFLTANGAAS